MTRSLIADAKTVGSLFRLPAAWLASIVKREAPASPVTASPATSPAPAATTVAAPVEAATDPALTLVIPK